MYRAGGPPRLPGTARGAVVHAGRSLLSCRRKADLRLWLRHSSESAGTGPKAQRFWFVLWTGILGVTVPLSGSIRELTAQPQCPLLARLRSQKLRRLPIYHAVKSHLALKTNVWATRAEQQVWQCQGPKRT